MFKPPGKAGRFQYLALKKVMLESADRVLRVLELFSSGDRNLNLSEIAARMSLPKSSVHRLLATLLAHEFIERDASTRRYRLGIKVFEVGSLVIHERGLHSAAHPIVEELAVNTGETCHLAVLSGTDAVYVYKIDGPSTIIMSSRVGGRAPSYSTSIGKVLVAWAGEEIFQQVVKGGFHAYTRNTIRKASLLAAELEVVRREGYALDREELQPGLCCIAAPVRDHSGSVVAALGLAGPSNRLTESRLQELAIPVTRAAEAISRNLGYVRRPVAAAAGA
jgi:DNA-binding IclR family transcriptional regulator